MWGEIFLSTCFMLICWQKTQFRWPRTENGKECLSVHSPFCVVDSSHCLFYCLFVFCAAVSCCCNNPTSPPGPIKSGLICLCLHTPSLFHTAFITRENLQKNPKNNKKSRSELLRIHRFHLTGGNAVKPASFILKRLRSKAGVTGLAFMLTASLPSSFSPLFFSLPSSLPLFVLSLSRSLSGEVRTGTNT